MEQLEKGIRRNSSPERKTAENLQRMRCFTEQRVRKQTQICNESKLQQHSPENQTVHQHPDSIRHGKRRLRFESTVRKQRNRKSNQIYKRRKDPAHCTGKNRKHQSHHPSCRRSSKTDQCKSPERNCKNNIC